MGFSADSHIFSLKDATKLSLEGLVCFPNTLTQLAVVKCVICTAELFLFCRRVDAILCARGIQEAIKSRAMATKKLWKKLFCPGVAMWQVS